MVFFLRICITLRHKPHYTKLPYVGPVFTVNMCSYKYVFLGLIGGKHLSAPEADKDEVIVKQFSLTGPFAAHAVRTSINAVSLICYSITFFRCRNLPMVASLWMPYYTMDDSV